MLAFIELHLHMSGLLLLSLISMGLGYWIGSVKKTKIQHSIYQLETDMLNSHAEILRLSKEIAEKEKEQNKSIVVTLNEGLAYAQHDSLTH
jgi:hypothetical protein